MYVDASFSGEWNERWSKDTSSVMSRTGYMIMCAGCPVVCASKLQTEITLSTTESGSIAFSQSLCDTIPLLGLLKDVRDTIPSSEVVPAVHCTVHENNKECIELVETPLIRPRTKHIVIKYHHFGKHVRDGTVSVEYIDTTNQIVNTFTKALADEQFVALWRKFMA